MKARGPFSVLRTQLVLSAALCACASAPASTSGSSATGPTASYYFTPAARCEGAYRGKVRFKVANTGYIARSQPKGELAVLDRLLSEPAQNSRVDSLGSFTSDAGNRYDFALIAGTADNPFEIDPGEYQGSFMRAKQVGGFDMAIEIYPTLGVPLDRRTVLKDLGDVQNRTALLFAVERVAESRLREHFRNPSPSEYERAFERSRSDPHANAMFVPNRPISSAGQPPSVFFCTATAKVTAPPDAIPVTGKREYTAAAIDRIRSMYVSPPDIRSCADAGISVCTTAFQGLSDPVTYTRNIFDLARVHDETRRRLLKSAYLGHLLPFDDEPQVPSELLSAMRFATESSLVSECGKGIPLGAARESTECWASATGLADGDRGRFDDGIKVTFFASGPCGEFSPLPDGFGGDTGGFDLAEFLPE